MTAFALIIYGAVALSMVSLALAGWVCAGYILRIVDELGRIARYLGGPPPAGRKTDRLVAAPAAQAPVADEPAAERSGTLIDGVRFRPDAPTGGLQVGDPYAVPDLGLEDEPCVSIRHGQLCVRPGHEGPHVAVADGYITALWGDPSAQLDTEPAPRPSRSSSRRAAGCALGRTTPVTTTSATTSTTAAARA